MVADDLEFYHDKTGLSVGKQKFLAAIQKNICGKVRRDLVPGTLEVYPIKGYGAVELGTHRFHHPGHEETGASRRGKVRDAVAKPRRESGRSPELSATITFLLPK